MDPEEITAYLDSFADQILCKALAAINGEQLTDDTGTPDDQAYNQAITDAWNAVHQLREER
ncbi:hypothetical protein XF35_01730 [Streptomyces platensis subsp. clarensis]|nr:hypothetical protein [Streptomyces platensis subsp. clarensis]